MNHLTPQQWLDRGYRRHDCEKSEINRLADFMLQKRYDDELGKKYFITVYCYDRTRYPYFDERNQSPVGYMPTCQFSLGNGNPFFDIDMNGVSSIDQVEEWYDKFWNLLGQPYYEKF